VGSAVTDRHIPALDGLRGLAVLGVIILHYWMAGAETPLDQVVQFAVGAGWIGVDLFFVLSGFLITGILLDSKGRPGYFRVFYARRILRIFPLYFTVLAVLLVILPTLGLDVFLQDPHAIAAGLWPWFFLTNILMSVTGNNPTLGIQVSWSLSVEEQFYLLWPAIVLLCSRRRLLTLCTLMIVGVPILRALLLLGGVAPVAIYVLAPTRMDALAVGGLLAVLLRTGWRPADWARQARCLALASVGGLVSLGLVSDGMHNLQPVVQVAGYSAAAVFSGALLVLAIAGPSSSRLSGILHNRLLRTVGRYSYAMYLLHVIVRDLLVKFVLTEGRRPLILGSVVPLEIAFTCAGIALTLALAWLSWRVIERPCLQRKGLFVYGDRSRPVCLHPPRIRVLRRVA